MTPLDSELSLADVSVIVVLYNSCDVVPECLAALPPEVELIVIDNGSVDLGRQAAARARPDATVIRSETNLGFGGGGQLGTAAASRPVLLFLNPDARIEGLAVLRLLRTLMARPACIVGPRLLTAEDTTRPVNRHFDIRIEALWLLPAAARWFPSSWRRTTTEPEAASEHEVAFVEGACFMIRKADLVRLGGFDPDLFLYCEEASLAHRLRLRGGGAWYEPRAVVTHIGQTSTSKDVAFSTFHIYRSRVIFERKIFGEVRGRLRSLVLLLAAAIMGARILPRTLMRRGQDAHRDRFAILSGVLAGLFDRIGPQYRELANPGDPD